jgi:3-hydroxyacyl-[acyl-carrier-protein] dehydratase
MPKPAKHQPVKLEIGKILEILPHRYPWVLVDRVLELVADQRAFGYKMVSYNEPWSLGHFPGEPIMPGTLVIEALAQMGVVLAYASDPFDSRRSLMYFLGIDKAKFRQPVTPGDRLDLEVEVLQHRTNVWRFRGQATVNERLCAQGEFLASIVDRVR